VRNEAQRGRKVGEREKKEREREREGEKGMRERGCKKIGSSLSELSERSVPFSN